MAQAAVSIWTGVMEKFWPKDSTARSAGTAAMDSSLWSRVAASPGRSMPVEAVMPKASRYLQKVSAPRSWPMWIIQGLQEL